MLAARTLGAQRSRVLVRADSGDVSGDKTSVVGYLAATLEG
jgi:AmmeMemoRadiSam system protein B